MQASSEMGVEMGPSMPFSHRVDIILDTHTLRQRDTTCLVVSNPHHSLIEAWANSTLSSRYVLLVQHEHSGLPISVTCRTSGGHA